MTNKRKSPGKLSTPLDDPLSSGMKAAGGQILRGAGMSASAQQSGRGLGESSLPRNWDAGGNPNQDNRGTTSTGPDTPPKERSRQQGERRARQYEQQQAEAGKEDSPPPPRDQPSLDETTPPDVLTRNPDATRR